MSFTVAPFSDCRQTRSSFEQICWKALPAQPRGQLQGSTACVPQQAQGFAEKCPTKPAIELRFPLPPDTDRMAFHRIRQAYAERLVESSKGSFRDECLNEALFPSLAHATAEEDYNKNAYGNTDRIRPENPRLSENSEKTPVSGQELLNSHGDCYAHNLAYRLFIRFRSGDREVVSRPWLGCGCDHAQARCGDAEFLPPCNRLRVLALDVTDRESIAEAMKTARAVDVLVNNAGFGARSRPI